MSTKHSKTREGERGYVLFMTAILLIPMIAIAAIGVDFGMWYLQASRNQSAADAAALAGAVWLPDETKAIDAANEALERNGLNPGVDSSAIIDVIGRSSLRVSVATKSELSFTSLFIDEFAITRTAVGSYIPPTAIGSPTNGLGRDGLWLAISGDCSVRENGDLLAARGVAGYPGAAYPPASCGSTSPNPQFTGEYFLAVEVTTAPAQPISVQVYDGTYNPDPAKTTDLEFRPPSTFDTTFTLYDQGSVFDPMSGGVIASRTFNGGDASTDSVWSTIGTISAPVPGIYYVRVSTNGSGGLNSFGSNGFAVRAGVGTPFASCTTIAGDPGYSASCPQVYAVEHLPLYASLSNGSSDFYLAQVPPEQAGKQLEISLFDVGEGAERIEIINPDGVAVPFTWTTDCAITSPGSPPGCSGAQEGWTNPATGTYQPHTLNVAGSGNQVYADTLSTSLWNDRTVVLTVDIPADYATSSAGRWWRVRYTFGADITDRTTWSVRIIGDPVRLSG